MAVLAALLLTPALSATVCTFDDLPQVPAGSLYNIPNGYSGCLVRRERYGNLSADRSRFLSVPRDFPAQRHRDFSSDYYSFAFLSPAVFNGFWAIPSTNYFTYSSSPLLEIQVILSLAGNVVSYGDFTSVTSMAGTRRLEMIRRGGQREHLFPGLLCMPANTSPEAMFVDNVTFNSICGSPTISRLAGDDQ